MELKVFSTGMFESNSYILSNNCECVIIDAGVSLNEIKPYLDNNNLRVKYIILTHGHIDHISEVDNLRDNLNCEVLIHKDDHVGLENTFFNCSAMLSKDKTYKAADKLLNDRDNIEFGGLNLQIIHTPGHTPGGICIKCNDILFTGDTLFKKSIGRSDLEGGCSEDLIISIKDKLMTMDASTIIYPGHGPSSTVGFEQKSNPFLG